MVDLGHVVPQVQCVQFMLRHSGEFSLSFLVILYVLLHFIGRNLDVLCDDYWFFFFWSNINSFIIRVYSPPTDVTTIEASADLATKSASQLFKRGT